MPFGDEPHCAACKIHKSLIWRKGVNGDTLCNGCHLKRVNSFLRSQSQRTTTSKIDGRRASVKTKSSKGKGGNGRHGERMGKSITNRNRRTLFKQKVRILS